jgi:predicted transcriptional regulator
MKKSIKELLDSISIKTGWSTYKIAEMLDVSQTTVWRYMNDETLDCKLGLLTNATALYKKVMRRRK